MRGITTFIVLVALFSVSLVIAIPLFDGIAPLVIEMTPDKWDGIINNIWETGVKWIVVMFLGSTFVWAIFWVLRQEKQQEVR